MKDSPFDYHLDAHSGLIEVGADTPIDEIERIACNHGFTLGYAKGEKNAHALGDYLAGHYALEPYLKYGDTHDLLAALKVRFHESGELAETLLTPRSAAGPNLRYLLTGQRGKLAKIENATLRIRNIPTASKRLGVFMEDLDGVFSLLRKAVQAQAGPTFFRCYDPDSLKATFDKEETRPLAILEYEGDEAAVRFYSERFANAFGQGKDLGELLEEADEHPFLKAGLPVFLPLSKNDEPLAHLHFSLLWKDVMPLIEQLQQRSAGVYRVQASFSHLWHHAALLSFRLIGKKSEAGEQATRMLNDIVELVKSFDAAILEAKSLSDTFGFDIDALAKPAFRLEGVE